MRASSIPKFVLGVSALVLALPAARAAPLDLYEWIAPAPVVAAARIERDAGKLVEVELAEVFRGGLPQGTRLMIDLRRANREREEDRRSLRFEAERAYLVLLTRDGTRSSSGLPVFGLVRGIDGARELPAEGSPAVLDAIRRFVGVQDRKDEIAAWTSFRELLEEANPVLLENSLDLFLKFRRGDLPLLPVLRPLLAHPRADLRARTARLIGQIVEHRAESEIPDDDGILSEIYARARRDPSAEVRVAATAALGGIGGTGPEELLLEIARSDPEQEVRYEAEKLLFERGSGVRIRR
jgi:hypothetical protein